MGKILDKLIAEYHGRPLLIMDTVIVPAKLFYPYRGDGKTITALVVNTQAKDGITLMVKDGKSHQSIFKTVSPDVIISKYDYDIGFNPFRESRELNGICDKKTYNDIGIQEILSKISMIDRKRPYCNEDYKWSLENRQNLIDSIYGNLCCGEILTRKIEIDGKLSYEVIDGKQRLITVSEFINDMFHDSNGNLFSDFSKKAKEIFMKRKCFILTIFGNISDEKAFELFVRSNKSCTRFLLH